MVDNLTSEQRTKNMKAIKSVSKLESIIAKELWRKGVRYRRNSKSLLGKPDISIKKYKIVIFIDSCFWHLCPIHGKIPASNSLFWEEKLNKNSQRDIEVNNHYKSINWNVKRVWEHDIKSDPQRVTNEIYDFIHNCKKH
jgi:DNA mismatch endonuclease (patch repair protein)